MTAPRTVINCHAQIYSNAKLSQNVNNSGERINADKICYQFLINARAWQAKNINIIGTKGTTEKLSVRIINYQYVAMIII